MPPAVPDFFNGRDLSGWDGLRGHWSVDGESIVGAAAGAGTAQTTCLCSKRVYRDFELEFQVHLRCPWGSSGVHVRSRVVDPARFVVAGPQVDIGPGYWGCLFDERIGGEVQKQAPPSAVARAAVKPDGWTQYFVRCAGKRVTIRVNGVTTVDEEFAKLPEEGVIAWQLHPGPGNSVEFRDVRYRGLSPDRKGGG